MLPKNLVLDETAVPEDFDSLLELLDGPFKTEHEQTTLEALSLSPEGFVRTPSGDLRMTRHFLEHCAKGIDMPLPYAYAITPELFCENFAQRLKHRTSPVTVCRVGDIATGLVIDGTTHYRPACSGDVLRAIAPLKQLHIRRASVSYAGMLAEFVHEGLAVEPKRGDELGIAISNSEIGERHLKASAYSHRLVCTNGAVMSDDLGIARWPNDVRMTVAGCLRSFSREVLGLCQKTGAIKTLYDLAQEKRLTDVEFVNLHRRVAYVLPRGADPDAVLEVRRDERVELQQTVRNRGRASEPVLTRWNVYDTHNRITHAAHGRSLRVRRGLQEVGGELLSRSAAWPPVASTN